MDVYDKNANNVSKRWPIETTPDASTMKMLSIPESSSLNQIPEIFVFSEESAVSGSELSLFS